MRNGTTRRQAIAGAVSVWIATAVDSQAQVPRSKLAEQQAQCASFRPKLHEKARALGDLKLLVRPNGYIYTIDLAQLLVYFAQAADVESYVKLRDHAERTVIQHDRAEPYIDGFVAWKWREGEKPDASGTTEAIRLARGLWVGARQFNRPADAEWALRILDGYRRHEAVDQGVWLIRNYFGFQNHAFASNSYLVDYDADFVAEVAAATKDSKLTKLAEDSYTLARRTVSPCGLLYDIIQPEVATLYPELNLAAFSPNDVIQLNNCVGAAACIARGLPDIARKVLALGLNRLSDLRMYYLGRTGEAFGDRRAAVNEFSALIRLACALNLTLDLPQIAERALNEWRWFADHIDPRDAFTMTEILLAMQAFEAMKA